MKRLVTIGLILLGYRALAFGSAITSAQSGDWKTGATWVGGVAPGNGDTAVIFHQIVVSDPRIIGTSPAGGNIVVNLNSTGTIHVLSTGSIKVRGDVQYTAGTSNLTDAVIVDGGGVFDLDSSLASNATNQHYAFYPDNNFGFRAFKVIGSFSSRAVLRASSGQGALRMNGFAYGGGYTLTYADVTNMKFESFFRDSNPDPPIWDATYSTFTTCGVIRDLGDIYSTGTWRHEHNGHITSTDGAIFLLNPLQYKGALGTRSIQNNVFDVKLSTISGWRDFTIANNYMNDMFTSFFSSASYSGNFIRMRSADMSLVGSVTTSYFLLDADLTNPHVITGTNNFNLTLDGVIWGQSGKANGLGGDDSGEFIIPGAGATVSTFTLTRSILLPNGNGYSSLEMTTMLGSAGDSNTWLNYFIDFEHNTWFGGWSNGALPFSGIDMSETVNMAPGRLSLYRSNLVWNPQLTGKTATFAKVIDVGNITTSLSAGYSVGPTTNVCSPSNCDYNASYGMSNSSYTAANTALYLNQGRGYIGNFTSTPGTHDVDGSNPNFVDYHRNAEEFDAGYYRPKLGLSTATAWSSGASYSIGNVVSHSSGTYYWGDTINYRYTNSTGCSSSNPEPGAGLLSTWESCWEFATFQDLRDCISSGTTFTDSSIGASSSTITQTLVLWVRAGYVPLNPVLRGAAFGGGDIGAVQFTRGPSEPFPSNYKLFPSTNVWYTDITTALVSSSSTLWMDPTNGHSLHDLHPDFGTLNGDGSYNGIPYNIIYSTVTPRINLPLTTYATESDTPPAGGVPIASDVIVEDDPIADPASDRHLLLVDVSSGMTYEMFAASRTGIGTWNAAQLTIWYSSSNILRPAGWTSADAAGLPITIGLIRWDEIQAGVINHAIRFTLSLTHGPYLWPARHDADTGGVLNPPFGMRVRMKASVDISGASATSQIIFRAMKKYGMIMADNGGDWYVGGAPSSFWNDSQLHTDFINIGTPFSLFEVVDESTWIVNPNSAEAQAPVIPGPVASLSGAIKVNGGVKFK